MCIIPCHERDAFQSMSQMGDMLELYFSGISYFVVPYKSSSKGT